MAESVPIILTKLQPPLARRNMFRRERLTELLRPCLEKRLTLIRAAAGYGKTTLIAGMFAEAAVPLLWYSLSRSDRDLATFLAYLTEAFERQWPGIALAVQSAPASGSAFVAACVNHWLGQATGDFILVIDDFQLVERVAEISQVLDQLISHAPPQAHFVLATRAVPPFECLPRLRAAGEVLELGEAELRFGLEEATALLNRYLKLNLPPERIASLVEHTEGWALGLLMAAQSVRAGADVDDLAEGSLNRRVLFEYLSEEALHHQPPEVVDFVTGSAVLSRLEPEVCDATLGRADSDARLADLEQSCLFVIRTPDGWLRYHRLFRAFLLQRLAADPLRRQTLHRRAAQHFEAAGNPEAAIPHWLKANAPGQAARLVAGLSAEILRAGRVDTLEFWLRQFPAEALDEAPELLFRWAQVSEARGEWDQALERYEQAARVCLARGDRQTLSDVLRNRGHILNWRKSQPVEAERLHRQALAYVDPADHHRRAAVLADLARDQLSLAHTSAAAELYRQALAIHEAEADRQAQLEVLLDPGAQLSHCQGEFRPALGLLRRAEQLARELNASCLLAEICNELSANLYLLGRHAEALEQAGQALALNASLNDPHIQAYGMLNQANAWEATCAASYTDLYRQYQQALHIEQAQGNQRFAILILLGVMRLARRGGRAYEAVRCGRQAQPLAAERRLRRLEGCVLVELGAAQIWVDAEAARAALESARQIFADCGDLYQLTAAHFWLAALRHSEDDPACLDALRECLRLAVSREYAGLFEAEPQTAIPLLVMALEHDLWPGYVQPILAGFGQRAAASVRPLLGHANPAVCARAQAVLEALDAARAAGEKTSAPSLLITGFGSFTVQRGGHKLEERDWGRRKVKRLLKYIALSPGRTLSKDAAIDRLWPEAAPEAANASFHRMLYHLRRTLEPLAPHTGANYVVLEGGRLRLDAQTVPPSDVEQFTQDVEAGRRLARSGDPAGAREKLAAAAALYTGDLCTDDLYDDWVLPLRENLRLLYLDALNELAGLAQQAGQPDQALGYLRQVFRLDAASEAACLKLMQALAASGQRAEALQHYVTCKKALADMNLTPSAELRAAHRELLST